MELRPINNEGDGLIFGYAESRIGGRAENQDNLGWTQTPFGFLVAVCDGMGGGPGGKTASTIAVLEIIASISEGNILSHGEPVEFGEDNNSTLSTSSPRDKTTSSQRQSSLKQLVENAVKRANAAVFNESETNPALQGMGSTATVLLINEHTAIVAHVGDSRVYQLRQGKKVFRTFDHSVVFEHVRNGEMTEEEARQSPHSNIITRALGIYPDVTVDVVELSYKKGDRFLLCTDGIHGTMPEPELLKIVGNGSENLEKLTGGLAEVVDHYGHEGGGHHDNLTLALLQTTRDSLQKAGFFKRIKLALRKKG